MTFRAGHVPRPLCRHGRPRQGDVKGRALDWNEQNIERLKALYAAGYSGSQIARELGVGCTRNMVISKSHRLGITGDRQIGKPARIKTVGNNATRDRVVAIAAVKASKPLPKAVVLDEPPPVLDEAGKPITLATVGKRQCRWYVADQSGVDGQLCANQADKSFCAHHQARLRNATAMQQLQRSQNPVPTEEARALKHA
jgi:GcrA cell cycle regulator